MHFEGTVNFNAPREVVWEYLMIPELASECAPGVQFVQVLVPEKQFEALATLSMGSVDARFEMHFEWQEVVDQRYAKMKAHGDTPGSGVDMVGEMRLTNRSGTTDLDWQAEISLVGQLAEAASLEVEGVALQLARDFFKCVKSKIEL